MARFKRKKKKKGGSSAGASKATPKGVCKCGSSEHKRTTHHSCPLNEKNMKDKEEEEGNSSDDGLSAYSYSDDSDGGGTPTGNSSDEDKVESWETQARRGRKPRQKDLPSQAEGAGAVRSSASVREARETGKGGDDAEEKKIKNGEKNGKRSPYVRSLVGCLV